MTSSIDASYPIQGRPTTASVRQNFAYAKAEIEALQVTTEGAVNVQSSGAVGDGVTDDTAAIQAAIGTGRAVFFPAGTYIASTLTIYSNTVLIGENQATTIIKLKDGTNADLIYGDGAAALWGGGTTGGIKDWGLINLTLDGNSANNTDGSCVAVYGYLCTLRDLYIKNAAKYGMRTEWASAGGATPGDFGMQGSFDTIVIDTTGEHGWYAQGPHDSVCKDVIVVDASQATGNTYDAINISGNMNARWLACHTWTRGGSVTNGQRYGIYCGTTGNEFAACHFEGSYSANIYQVGARCSYDGVRLYALRNGGSNIVLRSQNCRFNGFLYAPASGAPACFGITFGESGDFVSGNTIEATVTTNTEGILDFTYNSGNNHITVRGANGNTGTFVVGAPAASDVCDVYVTGTAGGTIRTGQVLNGIAAAGSSITDATALGPWLLHNITSGTGGVKLKPAQAGTFVVIGNNTAGDVSVYPNSASEQIQNLGGGGAYTLAARAGALFFAVTTTQWMVVG